MLSNCPSSFYLISFLYNILRGISSFPTPIVYVFPPAGDLLQYRWYESCCSVRYYIPLLNISLLYSLPALFITLCPNITLTMHHLIPYCILYSTIGHFHLSFVMLSHSYTVLSVPQILSFRVPISLLVWHLSYHVKHLPSLSVLCPIFSYSLYVLSLLLDILP